MNYRDKDLGDPSFFHSQLKVAEKVTVSINLIFFCFVLNFFVSERYFHFFFYFQFMQKVTVLITLQ